jgi:hypothetical protein
MRPGMARSVSSTSPSVKCTGVPCGIAAPTVVPTPAAADSETVAFYNDTLVCYARGDRARGVLRPTISGDIA